MTYLPVAKGFAYLVAILDLYSRKVLAFRVSNPLPPISASRRWKRLGAATAPPRSSTHFPQVTPEISSPTRRPGVRRS